MLRYPICFLIILYIIIRIEVTLKYLALIIRHFHDYVKVIKLTQNLQILSMLRGFIRNFYYSPANKLIFLINMFNKLQFITVCIDLFQSLRNKILYILLNK